jgi:hypothetical protein
MYTGPVGGTVVQVKVTKNFDGTTISKGRTYLTGTSLSTGFGVADDLGYGPGGAQLPDPANPTRGLGGSLMVMTDPSAVGLAGQGSVTRMPICEDMPAQ